jgi:DNA invertase Pin-like site-specific DNA recombinase
MRKVGYCRVSSVQQNLDRQLGALRAEGVDVLYREKVSGNSVKNRPELERAIDALGTGDILVVAEWDRAIRSMFDSIEIIKRINDRGVLIKVLDKPLLDLTTPLGRGFIAFLSAMAEDERSRIGRTTGAQPPRPWARGSAANRSSPTISRPRHSSVWPPARVVGRSPRRWPYNTPRWRDWRGKRRVRGGAPPAG